VRTRNNLGEVTSFAAKKAAKEVTSEMPGIGTETRGLRPRLLA
jgi:hypothetical protein